MIKLKNLWKVALATMAMTAMLVACDEGSSKGDSDSDSKLLVTYPSEAKVSESGVYTATLIKDGISSAGWGAGNGKETIKVVLAPKSVVQEICDGIITNEDELFIDLNKCYVYANNDTGNGFFTTATAAGKYVQPAGFSEYTGVAIKKDADGNYVVKVDINKLNSNILLAKGTDGDYDGDKWENSKTLKAANYIPMIAGSVTAADLDKTYPLNIWSAGVAIMEPDTEAFPTDITKEAVLSYTYEDLTHYCGTMTNWNDHEELIDDSFTFTAAGGDQFQFTVGGWAFQLGGAEITALNQKFELSSTENISFEEGVLTEGQDYKVTLEVESEDKAYVIVTTVN